jgi:hypothetical protein
MPYFIPTVHLVEARQVVTDDYDGIVEVMAWCDGRVNLSEVEEGDPLFRIKGAAVYANDWIVKIGGDNRFVKAIFEVMNDDTFKVRFRAWAPTLEEAEQKMLVNGLTSDFRNRRHD